MPAYRYLGDGSTNPSNVPARDITIEEWDAFDLEQRESVVRHSPTAPEGVAEATHLYEEVTPVASQGGTSSESEEETTTAGGLVPAAELISRAEAATSTEELDEIEAQAEGRVTVIDAVNAKRQELTE
jgi:hypothetical protein